MPPPAELAALIASTNACWPHATLIGGAGGFPDAAAVITVVAAARRMAFIHSPLLVWSLAALPKADPCRAASSPETLAGSEEAVYAPAARERWVVPAVSQAFSTTAVFRVALALRTSRPAV